MVSGGSPKSLPKCAKSCGVCLEFLSFQRLHVKDLSVILLDDCSGHRDYFVHLLDEFVTNLVGDLIVCFPSQDIEVAFCFIQKSYRVPLVCTFGGAGFVPLSMIVIAHKAPEIDNLTFDGDFLSFNCRRYDLCRQNTDDRNQTHYSQNQLSRQS